MLNRDHNHHFNNEINIEIISDKDKIPYLLNLIAISKMLVKTKKKCVFNDLGGKMDG